MERIVLVEYAAVVEEATDDVVVCEDDADVLEVGFGVVVVVGLTLVVVTEVSCAVGVPLSEQPTRFPVIASADTTTNKPLVRKVYP